MAGLSEEEKERVREVVDEIPRDVKERAEALLRNIQGHSLGGCQEVWGILIKNSNLISIAIVIGP